MVLDSNPVVFDTLALYLTLVDTQNELHALKAKIAAANVPVTPQMAELAELKGRLVFLRDLPTKSGAFLESRGYGQPASTITHTPQITAADVVAWVDTIEARVDSLQSELDQFNYTHEV